MKNELNNLTSLYGKIANNSSFRSIPNHGLCHSLNVPSCVPSTDLNWWKISWWTQSACAFNSGPSSTTDNLCYRIWRLTNARMTTMEVIQYQCHTWAHARVVLPNTTLAPPGLLLLILTSWNHYYIEQFSLVNLKDHSCIFWCRLKQTTRQF